MPVIVVSGSPGIGERRSGFQIHHMSRALDTQSRIFAEITCDQAVLDDPGRAPFCPLQKIAAAMPRAPAARHS